MDGWMDLPSSSSLQLSWHSIDEAHVNDDGTARWKESERYPGPETIV